MFAIFLSEDMDPFYQNISSFPTVFFTFFLGLCTLYWLVAVLGFIELEILDFDIPGFHSGEIDLGGHESLTNLDAMAGIMLKLGLYGVPVTIILSIVSLVGWFLSYYIVYFTFSYVPEGMLRYVAGVPVLLLSLYIASVVTAIVVKPLRRFFNSLQQQTDKIILGQTAVVRTSRVDDGFGEALLEDGGAGLILKVRSAGEETFSKGDRVVLLEYVSEENIYKVISEKEFLSN